MKVDGTQETLPFVGDVHEGYGAMLKPSKAGRAFSWVRPVAAPPSRARNGLALSPDFSGRGARQERLERARRLSRAFAAARAAVSATSTGTGPPWRSASA